MRIWFLRLPQKSRRLILPEGYRSRRVRYNVCKADIIPSRNRFFMFIVENQAPRFIGEWQCQSNILRSAVPTSTI